jgi:hypothetical protein
MLVTYGYAASEVKYFTFISFYKYISRKTQFSKYTTPTEYYA